MVPGWWRFAIGGKPRRLRLICGRRLREGPEPLGLDLLGIPGVERAEGVMPHASGPVRLAWKRNPDRTFAPEIEPPTTISLQMKNHPLPTNHPIKSSYSPTIYFAHLRQPEAFALIEQLVVIAIIGVLAALLFPAFGSLRKSAM